MTRHLFIAGCPRSGTSALTFLLNEHRELALGFERFKRLRAQLDPFHFKPAQFFSPVTAETDVRGELLYERLRRRWEGGSVRMVGDKVPLYTRVLPQLLERFPRGRVVVLVRDPLDVAASFVRRARDPRDWWPAENDHTVAMRMWHEALEAVRELERGERLDGGAERRVGLLGYEGFFAGEERWLTALLAHVGLPATRRLRAEYRRLAADWNARAAGGEAPPDDLAAYVREHTDAELLAWARQRLDEELERAGAGEQRAPTAVRRHSPMNDEPSLADDDDEEPPLTDEELRERERERGQLLEEMRRPGTRGEHEIETLERRFVEQAGELARRGVRARAAPVAARARVTFILPHQRHTTGGVYAIEQFARHMAAETAVSVAVLDTAARPIPGVSVRALAELDADALPAADVLLYPADMKDAARLLELPRAAGRPVLLFQGYGTPGSPVVKANLERAERTIAIAHWLVQEALRHGSACAYVPYGLDRDVFAPGRVPRERASRVSLMTHHLDWKGLDDALRAVALVRAAHPGVELVCFGVQPPEGGGPYIASPSRGEVAELLRSSSVHLASSWEEGFGLTGAEAIACGAALATTDTKGSRDYAIDGCTALVSSPRDPRALARNVIRLLDDARLRERLVLAGQRHLRDVMPPWPEAARRMMLALCEAA